MTDGPTVQAVERLGVHYLVEFEWKDAEDEVVLRTLRRRCYEAARSRLEEAGLSLRPDDEAWKRFDHIMSTWDVADQHMREWLGYRLVDAPLPNPEDKR